MPIFSINHIMSLEALLEAGKAKGALIDPRICFLNTDSSGLSAFAKVAEKGRADTPISIQIPNSLILKPENALEDLGASTCKEDSLILFKFYLACLRLGLVSNDNFKAYINLLPNATQIHSPLLMDPKSLYVFENTALNSSVIETKLKLLRTDFMQVSSLNSKVSFNDYLWAHLIVTSRAFPYRIVNPHAKSYEVMLLPIVDLLNHKPHARVEWSSNRDGDFRLSLLVSSCQTGEFEIFNNYGPKGNAELLMGYGFVLEDNEFELLQLSLTLDDVLKENLLAEWKVVLPVLSDFTNNVCETKNTDTVTESDAITVFMLNVFRPIPEGLLELFCYINKNAGDKGMTLKNTINGLNQLRQSLEVKYMNKLDKMPGYDGQLISEREYSNAKTFRQGQLKIYNSTKAEIKSMEKKLLKDHRKHFITLKDILKKDDDFQDFIEVCGWNKEVDQLSKSEMELLLRLWIMKIVNYSSVADAAATATPRIDTQWIVDIFHTKVESTALDNEFMADLYSQLIPALKGNVPELMKGDSWTLESWLKIDQLVSENSYEKGRTQEPLLIKPLLL